MGDIMKYLSVLWIANFAAASILAAAEARPVAEVKTEAKTEVKPEAKTEVKTEAKAEAKPEVKTEAKPEAAPGSTGTKPAAGYPAAGGINRIGVSAVTTEPISIAAGEKRVLTLPFAIESCKSNSSNVKIEHVSGSSFEVSGITPGHAVVSVLAGGLEKQYDITVFNSTLQTYQELGRLMDELPEVTIELHDNGLFLRGIITDPAHWRYFRRIIPLYADRCHNYVQFRPAAKQLETLKKQFADLGIPVVEKSGRDLPGKVAFELNDNILIVSGNVHSDAEAKKIRMLLEAQEWLNPEWNGGGIRAKTDLVVAPVQIDLGIVFVGVTRTQLERLGNSSADGKVLSWDVIGWFKALYGGTLEAFDSHGEQHVGGSATLQSNLEGSLLFFGSHGISDFRDAGHITLTNNSSTGTEFENGGTRSVKVSSRDTADLKEIQFGLKYKAKAQLLDDNMVQLELELERSLPPVRDGDDYVQRKTKTKTSFLCPLGKTAIIAGQKELTFTHNGPTGYAFLRHVPVLNWFFAFKEDVGEEMQILILVSPELMRQDAKLSEHPSQENRKLGEEVSGRTGEQERDVRERERHNWFRRMFNW